MSVAVPSQKYKQPKKSPYLNKQKTLRDIEEGLHSTVFAKVLSKSVNKLLFRAVRQETM